MTKRICSILVLCLMLTASGCTRPALIQPETTQPASTGESIQTEATESTPEELPLVRQLPMYSISLPVSTQEAAAEDGTVVFSYTAQSISLVGPEQAVADAIIVDLLNRQDRDRIAADAVCAAAQAAYKAQGDWLAHQYQCIYQPARMDAAVLSLWKTETTFTGASHPETVYTGLSYDLLTGRLLDLGQILKEGADKAALCDAVITAIEQIKDSYAVFDGFEDTVKALFHEPLDRIGNWYFSTQGLCFCFAPYEIAPYASGVITATIPYNRLTELLDDAFFPADIESATGELLASSFRETEMEGYSQIAEVSVGSGESKLLLFSDNSVHDLTVYYPVAGTDPMGFSGNHPVFYCNTLTPGDAVRLDIPEGAELTVTYQTNGALQTAHIRYDSAADSVTLS